MILLNIVLSDDLSCLKEFYKSTNGDKWEVNNNWNTSNYCQFLGITCNDDGNIIKIDLSTNNMHGKLPPCFN